MFGVCEPVWHKIILLAASLTGGGQRGLFAPMEHVGWEPHGYVNRALPRETVALAGGGQPGHRVEARFDLAPQAADAIGEHGQRILRIRGMWDYQRDLAADAGTLHTTMPTVGRFRVVLNDREIFFGPVMYWNYRRWRSWPSLELPVPANILRPTGNHLVVENHTRPFAQELPVHMREIFPDAEASRVSPAIRRNTTFHVSDIQIVCRPLAHLEVLSLPPVVRVGEVFRLEIYARQACRLDMNLPSTLQWLDEPALEVGRNVRRLKVTAPAANLQATLAALPGGSSVALNIPLAVAAPPDSPTLLLGHIVGGHLSAFALDHDYRLEVERFRDTQQGNLVAWLVNPVKAGDWITAESLPIDDIRRSDLRVLFRTGAIWSRDGRYRPLVRQMIQALGPQFIGLAGHEWGHFMAAAIQHHSDRTQAWDACLQKIKLHQQELAEAAGSRFLTINDPSLLHDSYRQTDTAMVGIELFPLHLQLNIASARGAARSHGDTTWSVIDSFECQAYGGLEMSEQRSHEDPRFLDKRAALWWLSLFHSYLAGSRVIFSESGPMHHVVTRQFDFEDPHLVDLRQSQRDLAQFATLQALDGQPRTDIALVKPLADVFSDIYSPGSRRLQPADFNWLRARAVWPNLQWRSHPLNDPLTAADDRRDYSDAPLGEADILRIDAPPAVLAAHPVVMLVGGHRLDSQQADRLLEAARQGSQVLLNLCDIPDTPAGHATLERLGFHRDPGDVKMPAAPQWQVADPASNNLSWFDPTLPPLAPGDAWHIAPLRPDDAGAVVLRESQTGQPILLRRPHGRGQVWLLNLAQPTRAIAVHRILNRFAQPILDRPSARVQGEGVMALSYLQKNATLSWERWFLLNRRWDLPDQAQTAQLVAGSVRLPLSVPLRQVVLAWTVGNSIIASSSSLVRLDDVRTESADAGNLTLLLQGHGPVTLTIAGPSPIRTAALGASADSLTPLPLTMQGQAQQLTFTLQGPAVLHLKRTAPW